AQEAGLYRHSSGQGVRQWQDEKRSEMTETTTPRSSTRTNTAASWDVTTLRTFSDGVLLGDLSQRRMTCLRWVVGKRRRLQTSWFVVQNPMSAGMSGLT